MQKKIGKLTLSKETLRNLDDRELDQVAGGVWTDFCTAACTITKKCSECCIP
jgi:natural product precursor